MSLPWAASLDSHLKETPVPFSCFSSQPVSLVVIELTCPAGRVEEDVVPAAPL